MKDPCDTQQSKYTTLLSKNTLWIPSSCGSGTSDTRIRIFALYRPWWIYLPWTCADCHWWMQAFTILGQGFQISLPVM